MNDEQARYSHIPDGPILKIFLCGPLRILRRENTNVDLPPIYQDIPPSEWGERPGPTLNLLKLLLCCENRHATKTFLADTLWPESGEKEGRHSLSQATRVLRVLLRTSEGEQKSESKMKSFLYESPGGEGFQIADQTLLWVDADAFEDAMKQATRAERQKHQEEVVVWLERAYELGKAGSFLPDDVYREWTNARRLSHEMLFPRCVRRLAECYVAEERYGEAEEVLRPYWTTHLTDEDMLTLLMQILQVQGLEKEALKCYEQSVSALDEELGVKPHTSTTNLADRLREQQKPQEIVSNLMLPRMMRNQVDRGSSKLQVALGYPLSSPYTFSGVSLFSPFSLSSLIQPIIEDERDWATWFGLKTAQLINIIDQWQGQPMHYDQLQSVIDQEIVGFDAMKPQSNDEAYILSRRQALVTITALPVALSSVLQDGMTSTQTTQKLLARCSASLTSCWHLLKGNELSLVEQTLSTYLLTLVTIAQQPSQYQKLAARLASQAYRLYGIVALHRNNLKARENYCQQALYFSEIAESPSLVVSAYISLASTFYYSKNPVRAAHIYQNALTHKNEISPLQLSRLYAELAVVSAQQKQEQDALTFLGLAKEVYPEHPETDPSFLYAEFTPSSMILEEGLAYLGLAWHFPERTYNQNAWDSFAHIEEQTSSTIPERIFFEIMNRQAETAVTLQDLEKFHIYIGKGIEGANRLGSKQRRQEIIEIYEKACMIWPYETRIKQMEYLLK